ncbi:MAG: tail fiber protein [Prevotellaceae bacterium]|nr:tail fiber protein [Prevotellaceae bacterium]
MKKHIIFSMILLFSISVLGQNSGLGFNYQAVVRGADGFVVASQSVELRFSLLPGQSATQASWQETHNATTDVYGTIGVTIGKGTKVGGVAAAFADVNFAAVHYWLKTEIKEGGNWRELSYTAFASVPYAEVASNALMMPAGTIIAFGGNKANIPAGWLLCDGAAVSRSDYAALYTAIGTAWGYGNNSTTFNLPDLRGIFLRGVSETSGKDPNAATRTAVKDGGNSGNNVGTYQGDAIRNITGSLETGHSLALFGNEGVGAIRKHSSVGASVSGGSGNNWSKGFTFDASRVVPTAPENRPINVYVYYIIKY